MIHYTIHNPNISTQPGNNITIWSDLNSEIEQVWIAFQGFGKTHRDPTDRKHRLIVSNLSKDRTELYKRALQRMGAIELP